MTFRAPESPRPVDLTPLGYLTSSGFLAHRSYSPDDRALYDQRQVDELIRRALDERSYSWPTCTAHIDDDPTRPLCNRRDPHEPHKGCVYGGIGVGDNTSEPTGHEGHR